MSKKPVVDPPQRQEWMSDQEWREFLEWDAWCARLNGVEYRTEDAIEDASLYWEQTHMWGPKE